MENHNEQYLRSLRLQIYKKSLEYAGDWFAEYGIEGINGLCFWTNESRRNLCPCTNLQSLMLKYIEEAYPELAKYSPRKKSETGNYTTDYWWEYDQEGYNKRIEVLRSVIKEMEEQDYFDDIK